MAKGILFVLMEPQPLNEEAFNDWYDLEHVPERAAVPGFEVLQRYVCTAGFPRYMALYDLESPEVLDGDAYRAIGGENSSVWTASSTTLESEVPAETTAHPQSFRSTASPNVPVCEAGS